jgi:hypothetical protein
VEGEERGGGEREKERERERGWGGRLARQGIVLMAEIATVPWSRSSKSFLFSVFVNV